MAGARQIDAGGRGGRRTVPRAIAPADCGRGGRGGGRRRFRRTPLTVPILTVGGDTAMAECAALLRDDFASFAARTFRELNPRTRFAANWHFELIAGNLAAVRAGQIRRVIVSVPPRHLKSHLARSPFRPGVSAMTRAHRSSASVTPRTSPTNCRATAGGFVASDWYQRLFPTRLSPQRQAVPEFARASRPRSTVS